MTMTDVRPSTCECQEETDHALFKCDCDCHPKLTEREQVALDCLSEESEPITGRILARKMMAAGRNTTTVAANQAANALVRKGLAYRHQPFGDVVSPKFGITDDGLATVGDSR